MLNIVVLRDIMKQKEVEKMKIIKVAAEGINLFKDRIDIDFYAEKRVLADNSEMVSNLFGRFFTNNVIYSFTFLSKNISFKNLRIIIPSNYKSVIAIF